MGQKIVIGPQSKGLRNDVIPAFIDNESFASLINAYQWRGRVKRKRGTTLVCRLTRYFNSTLGEYVTTVPTTISFDGSGNANLITGFSLQTNANIVPGTVEITGSVGPTVYTDPAEDGTLSPDGTINYATGAITIIGQMGGTATAHFQYTPALPVMGLEDFNDPTERLTQNVSFDTTYSYVIRQLLPYASYDVSFFKNPPTGTYSGYTQKTTWTPLTWNGQDYQQFWTTNYQNALWATNGIKIPFNNSPQVIGMPYKPIATVTVSSATTANLQITGHGLVVGDFVFVNQVQTTTGINLQTGYVTTVTNANNVVVTFPNATLATNGTLGIAQYLTSRSTTTHDCIRWYDGDPTDADPDSPTFVAGNGWVNFCPPLSQSPYSISDLPLAQYYLVSARLIVPFKDRLLFFGPVVQSMTNAGVAGSPIYLQDTVIYSQNGTPYYTASFTGNALTAAYNAINVPNNQTASPASFFSDQSGFGGFIQFGLDKPIVSVSANEDVLIVQFQGTPVARLIYTGNDIIPFNLFIINSEFDSTSTFSTINFDKGVATKGTRGYTISSQTEVSRIDLPIPDQVFQVRLADNGNERFTAQRDFINEWVYFTYPSNERSYKFPNQTLFFNYRDNSWAIFNECYTTYGQFRQGGLTWGAVGSIYGTWGEWNTPWGSGSSTEGVPKTIAGNQQGFVLMRQNTTGEEPSLAIQNISGSVITCPNHTLNNGDYILISDALGTVAPEVNGNIFQIQQATTNTFVIAPNIASGTYLGAGRITRLYIPFIQTKQFPVAWDISRKTRLGPQQYLLTTTSDAQVTLFIYLSQNGDSPYNEGNLIPAGNVQNSSLVYSTVLYTCPESTNIGLTAANTNLQMPTASQQAQIWHRVNTSLLGDTVQVALTLSDEQMTTVDDNGAPISQFAEIELHGIILDVSPSQILA